MSTPQIIILLLQYCDISTSLAIARASKSCYNTFKKWREEILYRNEYVNIKQMFKHCSMDLIIRSREHKFFDMEVAAEICYEKHYEFIHDFTFNFEKPHLYAFNKSELRRMYQNGDYHKFKTKKHKYFAAKVGFDIGGDYLDNKIGLQTAFLLKDEKMIQRLKHHGNFPLFCKYGRFDLIDEIANEDIHGIHTGVDRSNDPIKTLEYVEKRGLTFPIDHYYSLTNIDLVKKLYPRVQDVTPQYISSEDYDVLMIFKDKLLETITIEEVFNHLYNQNIEFTLYLITTYGSELAREIDFTRCVSEEMVIELIDYLDHDVVMEYVSGCDYYGFDIIRFMVKHRGVKYVRRFRNAFIKKYYS